MALQHDQGQMRPIQDYALIGDCRGGALVSRGGSIDWLCWPRFDSPSIFGSLLDPGAGCWRIAPAGPFESERHYIEGTNVLVTRFQAGSGSLRLTDLMPVASEQDKTKIFLPDHQIVRRIECEQGEVDIEMVFEPRLDYGRLAPRLKQAGPLGLRIQTAAGLLVLRSELELDLSQQGTVKARARLRAGETRSFSLTFEDEWIAVLPPLGGCTHDSIKRSTDWWQQWSSRLTYHGPCREAVLRSALALRLLVYAPSGAIVAAPTTSLPERIGGDLNWDYRFCWLRDASLTMRALFGLGFVDEAEAFLGWILHSTRLTRPMLRILYDVYGKAPPPERILEHLSGYRGSPPVRIGNAAKDQLQLDVYGEVIDAATQFVQGGGKLDRETQRLVAGFGEYVCRNWQQADEGIWEPRSGKAHHTHSRLLCWVALDRLIQLDASGHLRAKSLDEFTRNRALIRSEIELRAWNPELGSYVATLDGDNLDASLLLLAWYGFESPSSDRMRQTYSRIREHLGAPRGLLYRYRSGESPGEGAFGVCGFWGAEFLALGGGTVQEATDAFEGLVTLANDVGLFAEELDPQTGDALGNFPQGFTHVGLINAALSLSGRLESKQPADMRPKDAAQTSRKVRV